MHYASSIHSRNGSVYNKLLIIVVILKKKTMKKKLIGVLVFLIAMFGVMYFMGVFDKAGGTEDDHKAGEEIGKDEETDQKLKEGTEYDVWGDDSTEVDDEDFDPESML